MTTVLTPGSRRQAVVALGLLGILNLSDALVTIYVLQNNLGYELNPLAAYIYGFGALPFLIWKIGTVVLVSWMAWEVWWHHRVRIAIGIVTGLYGLLAVYQYLSLAIIWSLP